MLKKKVKNEDHKSIFKIEDQITFPTMKIESKEDDVFCSVGDGET